MVAWTSEELGLKVPGEALVPYLDMMAGWLKLKLDEVGGLIVQETHAASMN